MTDYRKTFLILLFCVKIHLLSTSSLIEIHENNHFIFEVINNHNYVKKHQI